METVYEALADPTRRHILDLLRERPRLIGELTELLEISQPGVSKQLRLLREVGLGRVRKEAQRRWYELVFKVFSECEHLTHGWGSTGWTFQDDKSTGPAHITLCNGSGGASHDKRQV